MIKIGVQYVIMEDNLERSHEEENIWFKQKLQSRPIRENLLYDGTLFIQVNCVRLMHEFVWKMVINKFSYVVLND